MRVKVTQTQRASSDGVTINEYQAGKTYDMPDNLGQMFIEHGWGKDANKKAGPSEDKKADGAAESKSE